MAPKHLHALLPHYKQPDDDVEEVGGSVVGNPYTTEKANFSTPPDDQPTCTGFRRRGYLRRMAVLFSVSSPARRDLPR